MTDRTDLAETGPRAAAGCGTTSTSAGCGSARRSASSARPISQLALPLVAILVLHATTFEVGLLIDLRDARRSCWSGCRPARGSTGCASAAVLIVNDLVRAAALGSIPLAQALDVADDRPAVRRRADRPASARCSSTSPTSPTCPQLVDRTALVEGNSKLQASESVSQIAGPSVGGLLIQALTAPYAVLVDAVSFLWSAAGSARSSARPPKPERKPDRHLGREIARGTAVRRRQPAAALDRDVHRHVATCSPR